MKGKITYHDIRTELQQLRKEVPTLKDDGAFVLWFLRAYISDSPEQTQSALTGESSDKNIDAILIDSKTKQVHVVQGKFRHSLGDRTEKRNDVLEFANVGRLPWASKADIDIFLDKLTPITQEKINEMVRQVKRNQYSLRLYYVTTGRIAKNLAAEAVGRVRDGSGGTEFFALDASQVVLLFNDYLLGVAPAVPSLTLKIQPGGGVQGAGVIRRFDPENEIESWVFSMSAREVGEMFAKAGIKLFARNVRGYLGETTINRAMVDTLTHEPRNFWYFNNGVTIVCDEARAEMEGGQDVLWVKRPQVINGQQTTRTLQKHGSDKATVLVRVIRISRTADDDLEYETLVSKIVRATNWQNAIKPSDLVTNDQRQVYLERELRKLGYHYIRKRQTKSEARRFFFGGTVYRAIKKDELAQAVAACELDPALVRSGKEGLFDDRYYSTVFGASSVQFYLSRFWLMRRVQIASKGFPERAYAKWVALNFARTRLKNILGSGTGEQRFRRACEWNNLAALHQLNAALDGIFRAVLAFYRAKRGHGAEARDISTFFKLSKAHSKFEKFWNSGGNTHRVRVSNRIRKFRDALKDIDLST